MVLHNESEPYDSYLTKEDAFFFQLVYDPFQKTLQADRGTIREGPDYQAEIESYSGVEKGKLLRYLPFHWITYSVDS